MIKSYVFSQKLRKWLIIKKCYNFKIVQKSKKITDELWKEYDTEKIDSKMKKNLKINEETRKETKKNWINEKMFKKIEQSKYNKFNVQKIEKQWKISNDA